MGYQARLWAICRRMPMALFVVVPLASAAAQTALPAPAIIVVDMTQIMRDAKAAKDVQAQIETEMNNYTQEVSHKEDELKTLREDLERQRNALAPEVFNARSQDYQQRYADLDHDVQTKRQAMQQSYSDAMTKVENTALQIIADVAKEHRANMVLTKEALLYLADGVDVTAEVTQRLDAKLPTMSVTMLKVGGDAADKSEAAPAARN